MRTHNFGKLYFKLPSDFFDYIFKKINPEDLLHKETPHVMLFDEVKNTTTQREINDWLEKYLDRPIECLISSIGTINTKSYDFLILRIESPILIQMNAKIEPHTKTGKNYFPMIYVARLKKDTAKKYADMGLKKQVVLNLDKLIFEQYYNINGDYKKTTYEMKLGKNRKWTMI